MLTSIKAGPYTIRGISVGGVYTSLLVPELDIMLDVGLPPRTFSGVSQLFLSHGHVDHAGSLASFLGIRALMGQKQALRVFMPAEIVEPVQGVLNAMAALQRYSMEIVPIGMAPGQIERVRGDLWVRAVRTFHPVPSLGYVFMRRIKKLRPEYSHLSGDEIGQRRRAGEELFDEIERAEIAYATDTLVQVLDHEPELFGAKVLILECTFLDQRKSLQAARAGCHIHLDELLERAESFRNDHLVLMHFSQIYKPAEVREILAKRCPKALWERITPFVSEQDYWPG